MLSRIRIFTELTGNQWETIYLINVCKATCIFSFVTQPSFWTRTQQREATPLKRKWNEEEEQWGKKGEWKTKPCRVLRWKWKVGAKSRAWSRKAEKAFPFSDAKIANTEIARCISGHWICHMTLIGLKISDSCISVSKRARSNVICGWGSCNLK